VRWIYFCRILIFFSFQNIKMEWRKRKMEYKIIAQLGSYDIKSNWLNSIEEAYNKREQFRLKFPKAMIQIIDGTGWLIEITGA